ncbi:hypothetical protein B0H14DRAFT_3172381 [Mycena olivaceomarginata]|nr:hypothetical protein B0H14DRAFT_3172381 [Mycena olivaceomarginata]
MSRANEGMAAWLESPAMNSPKAIPRWFRLSMPNDTSRRLSFGDTVDEDHDDVENSGQDAEDGSVARWACHTQAGAQRRAQLEAGKNGRGNAQEGGTAARRVRGGGESGAGVHGGRAGSTRARGAGVDVDWDGRVEMGTRMRSMCGWRKNGTGAAAPLPTAKDTTVRWAQSETGGPKRWMRDGTAWPAPHSCGRRGVERAQVVAAQNGHGSAQEEAAVAESTRGGTGVGRGYSIEGGDGTGIAGRGRACSGGVEVAPWRRGKYGGARRCGTGVRGAVRGQSWSMRAGAHGSTEGGAARERSQDGHACNAPAADPGKTRVARL